MKINEIIRSKRLEQGLTQEQVASYLGVSAPAVNKWERAVSYPDITLLPPLARLLGASDLLLDDTVTYLRVQLCFAPMAMLQLLFESFFVTAGRPGLGLGLATAAGVTNAVLDYLYMGPMQMGILGAALALLRATRFPPWRGCSFSCSAGRGSALAAPTGICACWAGPASTARPRW